MVFIPFFYQQFFQFVLLFTLDLLMDFSLLTFGDLLHPLNGDLKNQIRNFEKQKKQIVSAKYGILFNRTFLNEELHPTYTYIYICFIKNYAIFIVAKNIVCLFQLSDLVFYFHFEHKQNLS